MRFTPLDAPAIMTLAKMTKRMTPTTVLPPSARLMFVSRTNETSSEAGVRYCSLGNCSASPAKMMPTRACPMSFSFERRPRLRCLLILMKSSRKPTKPRPAMRKSTSSPLAVGGLRVKRWARK